MFHVQGKRFSAEFGVRLLVSAAAIMIAWKMVHLTWEHVRSGGGIDFDYFWDAGVRALNHHAADCYLPHMTAAGRILPPLGYPPQFLLVAAPLALLTYGAALVLWLILTGLAYFLSSGQPMRLAILNPPAAYNILLGQIGFLTSALLVGGASSIARSPLLGGALLGAMIIKPHLALMVPVALIAGREWRACGAAAATALVLLAAAAFAFGPNIYADWWRSASQYGGILQSGFWHWNMIASAYGTLRWSGLGNLAAILGQFALAALAATIVAISWRQRWPSKVAVLAAASLLAPPYLFSYDAVMMIAPLGYFAAGRSWKAVAIWALMLEPLFARIGRYNYVPLLISNLPNTLPIAAALSLFLLWKDRHEQLPQSRQYGEPIPA
jgi:hypothetical protein